MLKVGNQVSSKPIIDKVNEKENDGIDFSSFKIEDTSVFDDENENKDEL